MVTRLNGNQSVKVWPSLAKQREAPPVPVSPRDGAQFYIPYTAVHPLTVEGAPPDAIWCDVSGSDIAYFGAICDWWDRGETFAILEHDVVCRPDIVAAFNECPEPWCLFGYDPYCSCGNPDCREAWRNAIGCTRFRAELMAAVPDAASSIVAELWDWHNVCDGLGNNLRAAGFTHHWHEPPVFHHRLVQRPEGQTYDVGTEPSGVT